jgi:DNA recombination protein RmuC
MIFKATLTTKINPPFTINVPSSFAKSSESGYKAA